MKIQLIPRKTLTMPWKRFKVASCLPSASPAFGFKPNIAGSISSEPCKISAANRLLCQTMNFHHSFDISLIKRYQILTDSKHERKTHVVGMQVFSRQESQQGFSV